MLPERILNLEGARNEEASEHAFLRFTFGRRRGFVTGRVRQFVRWDPNC